VSSGAFEIRRNGTRAAAIPNNDCFDAAGVERPGVTVSANGLSWIVRTAADGVCNKVLQTVYPKSGQRRVVPNRGRASKALTNSY